MAWLWQNKNGWLAIVGLPEEKPFLIYIQNTQSKNPFLNRTSPRHKCKPYVPMPSIFRKQRNKSHTNSKYWFAFHTNSKYFVPENVGAIERGCEVCVDRFLGVSLTLAGGGTCPRPLPSSLGAAVGRDDHGQCTKRFPGIHPAGKQCLWAELCLWA